MPKQLLIILLVLIGISVLVRCAAAIYLGDPVEAISGAGDQLSYHTLGLRVLQGNGFSFPTPWWPATKPNAPTAHWSYLYTFYITTVYALFGEHPVVARLIQAILTGFLQPLLAYLLADRLFGVRAGLAAAALTTFYAYFIFYGATLMTEAFYITTILLSLYLAILIVSELNKKPHPHLIFNRSGNNESVGKIYALLAALGASLAATVLLRQLFMLFLPILFLWMWWSTNRKHTLPLLLPIVIIVVSILPFTIYNSLRFDRFVLLNTNAGFAFFWGNHPIYGTEFIPILPSGQYQSLIPAELSNLDEAALEQALLRRGLEFIGQDPVRYLRLSMSRIPVFFMFWPTSDSELISNISRAVSAGLLWPFMVYGLIISLSSQRRSSDSFTTSPAMLLYLFITFYTLIHLLSWALIRYRLPVDAVLLVFAGLAFADLYQRIGNRLHLNPQSSRTSQL
jgi:4-amino-4-deoxy-L-arabinose transferase-like glycosyltransferase